ncbi:MAG: nitrilase-related carbon-nitrogen hydrolase [Planctomycetota bacterium]
MILGTLQMAPVFGEPETNVRRATDLIVGSGADLVVLPELVTSGYQFADRDETLSLAEPVPDGASTRAFTELARAENVLVCFGLPEIDGDKLYNTAVLVGPEGPLLVYRKSHLFWDEFDIFTPGDLGFPVVDLPAFGTRVGIEICFDWVFPEATRLLALAGAEVVLHPSNLVLPYCQRAMVARSLENGVFTVTTNRVGTEQRAGKDALAFTGGSQILDVKGEKLAGFGPDEEGLALAGIDPATARNKMLTPRNDILGDRRPNLYGPLAETAE